MKSPLLSRREREVLELIANEYTSDEIANKLFISNHTAHSHRKNLLSKLSVKNAAGLVRRGFELGFLELNSAQRIRVDQTIPGFGTLSGCEANLEARNATKVKNISASYLRNAAVR